MRDSNIFQIIDISKQNIRYNLSLPFKCLFLYLNVFIGQLKNFLNKNIFLVIIYGIKRYSI